MIVPWLPSLICILICMPIIKLLLFFTKTFLQPQRAPGRFSTMSEIRELLDPSPAPQKEYLLAARALANARFHRAFNIRSAFTSPSSTVHISFKKEAVALLAKSSEWNWHATALLVVQNYLPSRPNSSAGGPRRYGEKANISEVDFAQWVKCVTFSVVLIELFSVPLDDLIYAKVEHVTSAINTLWVSSKSPTATTPNAHLLPQILSQLHEWITSTTSEPYPDDTQTEGPPHLHNPLELILPAYETLWRVIATAIAYVVSASNEDAPREAMKGVLRAYNTEPTQMQFRKVMTFPPRAPLAQDELSGEKESKDWDALSVEAIVKEVMRLHPPTRHIARANLPVHLLKTYIERFDFDSMASSTVTAPPLKEADIETLHRSTIMWGPSAHAFLPSRHCVSAVSGGRQGRQAKNFRGEERLPSQYEQQRASYMPFGIGPLSCPAKAWAPARAGLIVVAILSSFGFLANDDQEEGANEQAGYEVVKGKSIGGRVGWDGWLVRTDVKPPRHAEE